MVQSHSEDVVLGPVEEVEVVIVLEFRGVEDSVGEGGNMTEVLAVLLVGNLVVSVEDGVGDGGGSRLFGSGGFGFEGEDLGVVEFTIV